MAGGEGLTATTTQPNLSKQDLSTLDVTSLTPLSPEVISNQATINIGTIGHVAHGKSTVVKALSGVQTVRFKNELERNITIKLGAQERADSVQTPEEDVAMPSDGPPTETAGARSFAGSEKGMEESESSKKKTCTRNSKRRRSYSRNWKEDEEYEVERILEYEYDGQHWYRIKWRGWSHEYNTWEPLPNLTNSSKLIDEFHNKAEMLEKNRSSKKKRLEAKNKIICTTLETYVKVHYPKQKLEELLQNLGQYPKCPSYKELEKSANAVMNNKTNELKTKHLVIGKWAIAKAREQQLKELAEWEKEINEDCTDPASITVENDVDLEGRPNNFKYINKYISNSSITIPNEPLVGCDCGNVCDSRNRECCAIQAGAMFAYTKNKTLRITHGFPIYECNSRCSCGDGCSNRVVQLGRKYPLCIFRTSNGRGWGVRSLNKISKGAFICEYVGEVITTDEAEKRGREYDSQGRTYLFDLDYNQTEQFDCLYTVDAAMNGNLSHFINHSCDPNLEVFAVWIDCLDPNLPRLALFACKDIYAGEEITFDYSPHTECGSIGQPSPSRHARKFELENKSVRTLCKCGSAKCRREFF